MLKISFILIAIIGICYYMLKKRKFDFFTIAYFSALAYFLPGFYGYSLFPPYNYKTPITDTTYIIFIMVLVGIIFTGFLYDKLWDKDIEFRYIYETKYNKFILINFSLVMFILMLITTGSALFSPFKAEMLEELNRFHLLWSISTSLLTVMAFINKDKKLLIFGVLFLFFDVYIGFRSTFAITVIAILMIHFNRKGKQRFLIENKKMLLISSILAGFFFVYKQIYAVVKLGRWDIVQERLSTPQFYLDSITNSEPFFTQTILNQVVNTDFSVDGSHMIGILYLFILFAPELGAKVTDFNSLYQHELFPNVEYGMASNIWAEMYSINGLLAVMLFIIIFNLLIVLANRLLYIKDISLKATVTLIFTYWVFYIHRNDLIYELNLQKRILIIWIIVSIFSFLIIILKNEKRKG